MDRILIIYPAFAMILLTYFSYIIMILIGKKYTAKKEIKYRQFKLYTGVFPDEYEQSRQHLKKPIWITRNILFIGSIIVQFK